MRRGAPPFSGKGRGVYVERKSKIGKYSFSWRLVDRMPRDVNTASRGTSCAEIPSSRGRPVRSLCTILPLFKRILRSREALETLLWRSPHRRATALRRNLRASSKSEKKREDMYDPNTYNRLKSLQLPSGTLQVKGSARELNG
jgi:hypothetical protein